MSSSDSPDKPQDKIPDFPAICQTRGDQEMVDLARASGLSPAASEAVASIDAVMHKVRRSIQRREFGRQVMARLDPTLEVTHLDAISAIAHNPVWDAEGAPQEVTVGLIAERLGIDPSRASRVVADVVERGYARRVASQLDARRICLELTPKGQHFLEAVRHNKLQIFARALGKWNERELVVFAALLDRFSNWATEDDGIERSAENIKQLFQEDEATAAERDGEK
jgi:DNA-binding MarR family transcriptional regulator